MCVAVITNYTPATVPSNFFDLNTSTWLNNGGDVITLSDGTNSCTITYARNPGPGEWDVDDGCVTVGFNGVGVPDCSLTPTDLDGTALPVDLVSFTAEENGQSVQLNWTTASEENNSHFEIEYSIDGLQWLTIGQVQGVGNSDDFRNYSFTHSSPTQGSNFYRLKQVDLDQAYAYSDIVRIDLGSALKVLASNRNTLEVFTPEQGLLSYEVYNTAGQLLEVGEQPGIRGTSTIQFPETLSSGLYFIRITQNQSSIIFKLVR